MPSVDVSVTSIRNVFAALNTPIPCWTTCCGSRGSTCFNRLLTSTSAMSGSVPGENVTSISRSP